MTPFATGSRSMNSSVRCTLPPVVSPMQTAGIPAAMGTLASVLDASKLGSRPSAVKRTRGDLDDRAVGCDHARRTLADRLGRVDDRIPAIAALDKSRHPIAESAQRRLVDRSQVKEAGRFRGYRIDRDAAIDHAHVQRRLRRARQGIASSSAMSLDNPWMAFGRPKSPQECPPGPLTVMRNRLLPTATCVTRPRLWPSRATTAPISEREASTSRIPRRLPRPSSPTLPVSSTSTAGASPAMRSRSASLIAAATATLLSPTPGPDRRSADRLDLQWRADREHRVDVRGDNQPRASVPATVAGQGSTPTTSPIASRSVARPAVAKSRSTRSDFAVSSPVGEGTAEISAVSSSTSGVTASAAARTASIRSGEARITGSPAHVTGLAHRCANSRRRPENATTAVSRLQRNDTITDHKIRPPLAVNWPTPVVSVHRRHHRTEEHRGIPPL